MYISSVHSDGAKFKNFTINADQSYDQFVARIRKDGQLLWYRRVSGSSQMKVQAGGEIDISTDGIVYVTAGFRNKLALYDQAGKLIQSVFSLKNNLDSGSVLGMTYDGYVVESFNFSGASGNVSSGVIDTRLVGKTLYLAPGLVLEGAGQLKISNPAARFSTSTSTRELSVSLFSRTAILDHGIQNDPQYGLVYYDLRGPKGVVLCFHGAGGSASGWRYDDNRKLLDHLRTKGYSYVCPTSLDRSSKQWNDTNNITNADIRNVDSILEAFGLPEMTDLFLIGHSNGGGFTSRYVAFSFRDLSVKAVQVSNSTSLAQIMESNRYLVPTLFSYAQCDPIVDYNEVLYNQSILKAKGVPYVDQVLDSLYLASPTVYKNCHQFMATPIATTRFFDTY